ncbi:single-stranded DNA-binding protein [Corynebacterium confusum]|uniref:single-stranded DNA-binding protein n=1 Tax=Corynebacterium confusum TaxID=71254 RepID=UPI0025B47294|nr:single-stranded DNA-binding protein [Corynebacterium confusum]WJY90715.1 Single-stranded DNA-binding protein [Corynebacterium confusum]
MAQGDTPITVVGNIVADPELRFTPSGAPVANFRVASTPRYFNAQQQQWEDGEAMFLTCNAWRNMAENVAETLTKGMRVIVNGRLKARSFQTRDGDNRTVFEIDVDEVGPSLKYAKAQVHRNPREGGSGNFGNNQGGSNSGSNNFGSNQGGNQGGFGGNQGNQGGFSQGGFGGNQQSAQDNDPWNSAPQAGGFSGADDEPPF